MIQVKPFKAIRPKRDKANLVASRSYLTYSESTLREKLINNPFTFLHVINPEYSLNTPLLYEYNKYKMVREKLNYFIKKEILIQEETPMFYIYQQITPKNNYTGIIAAAAVDDYLKGKIKVHEQTIEKREEMFSNYLKHSGFNAEPVLLAYSKVPRIDQIIKSYTSTRSEYEFTTTDLIRHNLWLIDAPSDIQEIISLFCSVDSLYIADGHHRIASSAMLCKQNRIIQSDSPKESSFNYLMSFLVDDEQICIYDFNRLLKDLNGMSVEEFLSEVDSVYQYQKLKRAYKPSEKDEICMYLDGFWYSLKARKNTFNSAHCVDSLDPSILTKNILEPILGVKDIRNDKRIEFMDGKKGMKGLKNAVDSGDFRLAFALKPIAFSQLKEVANQNKCPS
jgi:uncharacterized protein (DUF1015 family)